MKEIQKIIEVYDTLKSSATNLALATVIDVKGSSYRRTGARMLIQDNGLFTGGISGGCIEGNALKKAHLAISQNKATRVTYDTSKDDEAQIDQLKPLNPYGESKNEFDKWALTQDKKPFFWVGLKFFNVYGPKENHKGRMASVVWHAQKQIKETGGMKLFRSHNPDYKNGEQMRDFVYVKDVCDVMYWLMHQRKNSGIYNMGSGQARTFLDLTKAVFAAMDKEEKIGFIDTPIDIRDKYQYFTEADMGKLHSSGYKKEFSSIEAGVSSYLKLM